MIEIIRSRADFARAVREARKARGLSQEAVADAAGYSRTWLVNVESGRVDMPLETALWLAAYLGLSVTVRSVGDSA